MSRLVVEQSIHGLPCVQIHDDPALADSWHNAKCGFGDSA